MTFTITLPDEIEAQLQAAAARQDAVAVRQLLVASIEPLVASILTPKKAPPPDVETFERWLDELADAFEAAAGTPLPSLSDEAVSRAAIYEDHL